MKFSESLKKNEDFARVYRAKNSKASHYFVMYVLKNDTDRNRLGISVSKKAGNSVVRHHIARLVREAYRLHEEEFVRGIDIVLVARPTAKSINYHETERDLLHLAAIQRMLI